MLKQTQEYFARASMHEFDLCHSLHYSPVWYHWYVAGFLLLSQSQQPRLFCVEPFSRTMDNIFQRCTFGYIVNILRSHDTNRD